MKLALYTSTHKLDGPMARLGWALIRLVQEGKYADVTHVEAILEEHENGEVTIASASVRDGGVRMKRTTLNPGHWIIVDVPQWDAEKARQWFIEHDGELYDIRGAFASAMPIQWSQKGRWFCNQAVGAAVGLECPEIFGPAQFAVICHEVSKR